MTAIGIICEYNPFHNGHLYQINKIKEMFPHSTIICVMSGNYVERGEVSIINKWDKTKIALDNHVDLVIELPFVFASQSADLFCKGSIAILNNLKVDYLVFGSETNDINLLKDLATIQQKDEYQSLVKDLMKEGINYPTAMNKALKKFINFADLGPNDILGLGYIRELQKLNSKIIPITIKRTNDYHGNALDSNIVSAKAIRELLKQGRNINNFVPYDIKPYHLHFNNDYFTLLKYKIISEVDLSKYQTVDEGIENRIKKYILEANNFEDLINKIKTKRYTYHKISRMLIHILTSFTKEEAKNMKEIEYIRILGLNSVGKNYVKQIKKDCPIPIITKYINNKMLEIEQRVSLIYDNSLEYKQKIIIKK